MSGTYLVSKLSCINSFPRVRFAIQDIPSGILLPIRDGEDGGADGGKECEGT